MVDVTTSVLLEPVRLWSAPARLLAEGRWDEESQAVARGSHPRGGRIPHQLTERRHPGAVRHGRGHGSRGPAALEIHGFQQSSAPSWEPPTTA